MTITFQVEVEVERTEGRFCSREAITEALQEELENADPSSVSIEDSEYEVTSWNVEPAPGFVKRSALGSDPVEALLKASDFALSQLRVNLGPRLSGTAFAEFEAAVARAKKGVAR